MGRGEQMKIEHCEWSKANGEDIHGNTIWFCGHRTFCPYEKCELPHKEVKEVPKVDTTHYDEKEEDTEMLPKQKAYLRIFGEAKVLEKEGMLLSDAVVKLKTTRYALSVIEQMFNYKFQWLQRNIDWSVYDDKIIELKKQKVSHRLIALKLGISESAINKHWKRDLRDRA